MRAIVTGGAGFIGSYVVQALLAKGYAVHVIDNLSKGKREHIPKEATFAPIDITDFNALLHEIQEGDYIFHLAALTSVPDSIEHPLPYYRANVLGTCNILEAARTKKAKGIVFSSSAAVYGNQEGRASENLEPKPESPYALQKWIGEELGKNYSHLYHLPFIALRYFNVYGKGNHETGSYAPVTARFLKAKREGKPLAIVGDGEQTRDFIHVRNVAEANVAAASLFDAHLFEIINVSSGVSMSIKKIGALLGGPIEHLPPRKEIKHSLGDNSKYKKLLTPKLIPFEEGLQELL